MKRIFRHWKCIYLVCCLVYAGWVTYVGQPEFSRVNRQYRVLASRLEPHRIRTAALKELGVECRRALRQRGILQEDDCTDWPAEVVAAKSITVADRLEQARKRGLVKVVLFYSSFLVLFLLLPPLFLYLFVLAIVTLCKNIQIVRRS